MMGFPVVGPSLGELGELAAQKNWQVTTADPDMWGDTRVTASKVEIGTIVLVFDPDGKLAGGYLHRWDDKRFHTTRRRDVRCWLEGE